MRAWLLVAVAAAGCSEDYDVRVRMTPSQLQWRIYTSTCDSADIPSPGGCAFAGDGPGKPSPCEMATCATHAELRLGRQLVMDVGDGNIGIVENPPITDQLVITGCGKDMRVPLPTTLPAAPTITSFVGTHVEWTVTPPIDRVTIDYGTSFVWNYCAVSRTTTSYDFLDVPHENWAIVGACAPLVTTSTPLGTAHVRAGTTTEGMTN